MILTQEHFEYAEAAGNKSWRQLNQPAPFEKEDFSQQATVGLLQAADRFVPGPEAEFLSYATPRIYGGIIDMVRQNSIFWRRDLALLKKLRQAEGELAQQWLRTPTPLEIAETVGVEPDELSAAADLLRVRVVSLDAHWDEGQEQRDGDIAERVTDAMYYRELARKAGEVLSARELRVLFGQFVEGKTQVEIGKELGVGNVRICKITTAAQDKVQAAIDYRRAA